MSFTDEHPIPFGKHRGTKLANVPASYLLWLWENSTEHDRTKGFYKGVFKYIEDNLEGLKQEVKRGKK